MYNFFIAIASLLFIFAEAGFSSENLLCQGKSKEIVSVDTFRELADFVHDKGISFDPNQVFEGAIVFVNVNFLKFFFLNKHEKIKNRYILITHKGDLSAPGGFLRYLEDDKLIAWVGQNPSIKGYEKFHPIPIGIAGRIWPWGNVSVIKEIQDLEIDKEYLAYLNIREKNYPKERNRVAKCFKGKSFCYHPPRLPFTEYLTDLKKSKFVFSPRGNGLDCHRTWEAILMGSIPIVRTSNLDSLFEGLPVLIVNHWGEVTEKYLEKKYIELTEKEFDLQKLFIPYWKNFILNLLQNEGIERTELFERADIFVNNFKISKKRKFKRKKGK